MSIRFESGQPKRIRHKEYRFTVVTARFDAVSSAFIETFQPVFVMVRELEFKDFSKEVLE
jgi:hypothetical protein